MSLRSLSGGTSDWKQEGMPSFSGKKAFVLPGAFYGSIVALMAEAGFEKGSSLEDSDVIVFAGGADISPVLYKDKNVASYGINNDRDTLEVAIFERAKELGKVCFGICRGAQLLHACNGGKLWQNVEGHGRDHYIVDIEEDCRVKSTSMHHQMLMENSEMSVVAVCEDYVSNLFEADGLRLEYGQNEDRSIMEIEAAAYAGTRCFVVQGHPEVGDKYYRTWCMQKLHDYYMEWTGGLPQISEVIERMER